MTLTTQPEVVAAPAWQFFDASVAAVRRLGPSSVRLTLTGPELAGFGAAGCDQRFKLVSHSALSSAYPSRPGRLCLVG